MASFFSNILGFIFGRKKEIHVQLDPESVKANITIRAQQNQIAELLAFKAKTEAKEALDRQRGKDKQDEEEVKVFLNERKNELEKKNLPKVFSLKNFFKIYFDKYDAGNLGDKVKGKKKLYITSFDRSHNLSEFGDIGLTSDGDFALFDKNGSLVIKMPALNDIFQSIGALDKDIKAGSIPLNLDKEGGYIENIMVHELPEILEEGVKLRFSKARKRPVFEIVRELNAQISQYHQDLKESEKVNHDLQKKLDDLTRAERLSEDDADTSRADMSHIEAESSAMRRVFRNTTTDLSKMRQIHIIEEDNINQLENAVTELRKEAERQGVKLSDDRAMELIRNIRREVISDMPEIKVTTEQPKETSVGSQTQKI